MNTELIKINTWIKSNIVTITTKKSKFITIVNKSIDSISKNSKIIMGQNGLKPGAPKTHFVRCESKFKERDQLFLKIVVISFRIATAFIAKISNE